ncbi:alpha/beta hydrolase [Cohnella sp. AR92]|uniref:alpha/beta hydrolase family protein n=1 Tax=Cohnella sp. AR92 TaxID=648716 RepID=UPI000F8C6BA0|nr:alpha/beta hydrolase [Cohnella sp. AR92]RUS49080.1 alpha/beta hydrolase [Cohnella sp. AR92]
MNIETNRIQRTALRRRRGFLGLRYEEGLWRAAAGGIWVTSTAVTAVSALGAPTGLGVGFDLFGAIVLNVLALALSGAAASWLLGRIPRRVPTLTIGSAIYTVIVLAVIFSFGEMKVDYAIGLALLLAGIGAGAGVLASVLTQGRYPWRTKLATALSAILLAGVVVLTSVDLRLLDKEPEPSPLLADTGSALEELKASDPSQPGSYDYRTFTYGSGKDKHRPEFGSGADLISETADASEYKGDWTWIRKQFWGFDLSELPLNGRVWMPEGEGPWPLVLMAHGNHLMEDYSDEGYEYLGELLASRGFIAVSVDENFLNYSVWGGIPEEDMELRAWVLLQHIGQLQKFSRDPSSDFYGAIDFDRVALLGHSRGGQAVAMATDREAWFGEDSSLPDRESYRIRAVIAIAPTDTTVDGHTANLKDVTYLTLQGSEDADVINFYGERQYQRTAFSGDTSSFKASLYIGGANHGQFNTSWGARDEAMPMGLFLKKPELDGEQQRRIAKVYVSALLETALHDRLEYRPLFRDYRAGAKYLPEASYFNRYEDGSFLPVARYEDGDSLEELDSGATASAAGVILWTREEALDRELHGKGNKGVVLEWRDAGASYSIEANGAFRMPQKASGEGGSPSLVFSMADMSWQLKEDADPLDVRIEAKDSSGRTSSVSLGDIMPVQRTPRTSFTWLGWPEAGLDEAEYTHESESVFQTYRVPLSRFMPDTKGSLIDWEQLSSIVFRFEGASGKAMLDDIGFSE